MRSRTPPPCTNKEEGGKEEEEEEDGQVRTMGTEFSRRVSAWISVSSAGSESPVICADCSMWKIAKRDRNGGAAGQMQRNRVSRRRTRLQLRFVLRGINSMGTA